MEKTNHDTTEVNNNFYEKYNPKIRKIVARILNNANQTQNIDDCVNVVFLELMERLQQYNETRGSMEAFVSIITRSAALNYCKSNTRKMGELIGDDNIEFLTEPFEFENEIEFAMLVKSILKKLNEKDIVRMFRNNNIVYDPNPVDFYAHVRFGETRDILLLDVEWYTYDTYLELIGNLKMN